MTTPAGTAPGDRSLKRASFAQERLWFIEALDPKSALYNQLICYQIRGGLDTGLLQESITEVIRRHSALRTNLQVVDGQVYQSSSPVINANLVTLDLPDKCHGNALEEADRMLREEARRPFDLASEPLIRPRLVRLGQDELLLALVTHHTIMDGWSMGVFIKEVTAIYEALATGLNAETALPPAGIQYDEYSIRQRKAYDSGEYAEQLQYWMDRLHGDLPVLELPFDHPRPSMQTYDGRALTVVLSPELTVALKKLGRGEKATLFMTLLAAFFVLLHRYSRQEDIIVGCPIAGRNQFDIERMIGLCVNTLAIRSAVSSDQSFRDLLRQIRTRTLEAYENQDLPFEKLVEKLSVQRSLDVPPISQALFQLRNFPAGAKTINGCAIERYEPEEVMVKTDLTLEVTETANGLSCRFEYPVALFDRDSVTRMAGHWQNLLCEIASDPEKKISCTGILTDDELYHLKKAGEGLNSDYPRENIARLFEARARECPDAIAIRHADECMTYRQLNDRSNHLACRLREMNVRHGDMIVLLMERSALMIVAMLAILKAGGAYLPVSPGEPDSRIAAMLENVQVRAAITDHGQSSRMEKFTHAVLKVDDEAKSAKPPDCPEGYPGPEGLAYVMFTSGSTGAPKGVCIPHRGIARLVMNTDYIKIGPGDTVGHLSDPAFDASTFEIWGALLNGATLVVIDKDVALSPQRLKEQIRDSCINVLLMTTPLFHTIVSEDASTFCDLRDMLVGGDVLNPVHAMTFLKHCKSTRLINVYGPTENTTFSTFYEVRNEDCLRDSIPIGRPIANSVIYILDGAMQQVPAGVTGDIYVSGDGIALGYLDSPRLTASKFLPDPYVHGRMMYRTGDLGRFLPDGNVQFSGRADGQVKIRGFRVEIGEVTAALETHPSVRQAVVRTYQGPGDVKSLTCYLVKNDGTLTTIEELRQYAADRLPSHMVPASFTWIESVPLTSRGKIDYSALQLPNIDDHKPLQEAIEDSMTSVMASVWREVMGRTDLGLDDDFFNTGGHSLLAIRLITKIEEAFKVRLPISLIFTAPTIRQMTAVIKSMDKDRYIDNIITLQAGGDRPPLYCIHGVPGTLFEYRQLVQQIGDDQPVYGLQSPGLDGKERPLDSIEEMATRYVQILRQKQPYGPYHLIAYCAGGAIAYEMACELEAAGEKAGLLGIIDYTAPKQETKSLFWSLYRYVWDNIGGASLHISRFSQASPGDKVKGITGLPGFLTRKVLRLPGEVAKRPTAMPTGHATDYAALAVTPVSTQATEPVTAPVMAGYPEWIRDLAEPQKSIARKNFDAMSAYYPGKYGGKINLFMSTNTIRNIKREGRYSQCFGWKNVCNGQVDIQPVNGNHESILLDDSMRQIAPIVRKEIDRLRMNGEGHDR